MQRVSGLLPSWDRTRTRSGSNPAAGKAGAPRALDKVFGWAASSNRHNSAPPAAPTRFGREAYWPTTLDKECEKAARILKSFCTDGFLAEDLGDSPPTSPATDLPVPNYVTQKIPPRIIQNAVGIAVFSCMRSGLWMSGSGGSGILVARKADGTWSPPSGIVLHTAALGFVTGVDIYDCVLVINNVAVLELFARPRVVLGADVHLAVGPLAKSGLLENDVEIKWKELNNTVLTYLKARGKHQGVQLDGSLVTERSNENERFYDSNVNVLDILAGNVPKTVPETRPLFEVIKAAEGRSDFDTALMEVLAQQPAPGDAVIETPTASPLPMSPKTPFGIPDAQDPDPFGVIALEMAGLEIREAGTQRRPASSQFEYAPSPTSPLFSKFNRQSVDTYQSRSNRGSYMSARTQATAVTDACTQTDCTPGTTASNPNSEDGRNISPAPAVQEPEEIDYTKIDTSAIAQFSTPQFEEPVTVAVAPLAEEPSAEEAVSKEKRETADHGVGTDSADVVSTKESSAYSGDEGDDGAHDADDEDDDEDEGDEPIVFEVATAAQPARAAIMSTQVTQVIQAKGALVTIPKRVPPPLPIRSPARTSRSSARELGDVSSLRSPLRNSFQSTDVEIPEPQVVVATEEVTEAVSPVAETATGSEALQVPTESDKSGHHRASSSVYSVIPIQGQFNPPSIPQTMELTSSAEESEGEPQTPRDFHSRSDESNKTEVADINIQPHSGDTSVISVA